MLNVTRLHNSISAVSVMRRMLALSRDFANRREAFGSTINKLPLQIQVLADLEKRYRGNLLFTLTAAKLLGKIENNLASAEEKTMYRMMTPILNFLQRKKLSHSVARALSRSVQWDTWRIPTFLVYFGMLRCYLSGKGPLTSSLWTCCEPSPATLL